MITTIILTISRKDFLTEVLTSLELLECDATRTNILCIVDGDSNLYLHVRNLIQDLKFNTRLTVQYPDKTPIKKYDVNFRRNRIAKLHIFAKDYIGDCDNVFLTEDDTIIPRDTLHKLLKIRSENLSFGMAEGVELGRWGIPYVGAWKFDDIYEPKVLTSLERKESGIDTIDAGGFYCSLIKTDLYKLFSFDLFENLGPDISFGLDLRRTGYEVFIDWSINCIHFYKEMETTMKLIPSQDSKIVVLEKDNSKNWKIKY